ncbi:MAG: hypothetical protein ACE37H_14060 [Phycisphaeraceae bacterium]
MRVLLLALISLALASVYAVLRYHDVFFGVHPADQLPLYILNKAVSWAALVMIALAVGARPIARLSADKLAWLKRDRRAIGMIGFGFAAVHSAMSFALLSPSYYGKLYLESGKMNTWGELSMLTGIVGMALLVWQANLAKANHGEARRTLRRLGWSVLGLTAVHVAAMGWPGWLEPSAWPGGLPPITLWSFVVALTGLVLGVIPVGRSPQ